MLNKFIEVYYCDAMRFAKYIQSNHGGDIREVVTSPEGFPTEPKGYEFGDTVHALKIGAYEIAFLQRMSLRGLMQKTAIVTSIVSFWVSNLWICV